MASAVVAADRWSSGRLHALPRPANYIDCPFRRGTSHALAGKKDQSHAAMTCHFDKHGSPNCARGHGGIDPGFTVLEGSKQKMPPVSPTYRTRLFVSDADLGILWFHNQIFACRSTTP